MRLTPELFDKVYPIVQVEVWGKGVYKIIRKCRGTIQSDIPKRGTIKMISRKSLIRLMAMMQATDVKFWSMLTLTYPRFFPDNGHQVKQDLNALLQKYRRDALGNYVWFYEFQERGAPHIHILSEVGVITPAMRVIYGLYWTERIATAVWFEKKCPEKDYNREVLKIAKVACHPASWERLKNTDGGRNYVMKYAAKEKQKTVPVQFRDVGRNWGASREVMPPKKVIDVTAEELYEYLDREGYEVANWDLIPKYVWKTGKKRDETLTREKIWT